MHFPCKHPATLNRTCVCDVVCVSCSLCCVLSCTVLLFAASLFTSFYVLYGVYSMLRVVYGVLVLCTVFGILCTLCALFPCVLFAFHAYCVLSILTEFSIHCVRFSVKYILFFTVSNHCLSTCSVCYVQVL